MKKNSNDNTLTLILDFVLGNVNNYKALEVGLFLLDQQLLTMKIYTKHTL